MKKYIIIFWLIAFSSSAFSKTFTINLVCDEENIGYGVNYFGDFYLGINYEEKTGKSSVTTGFVDPPPCKIQNPEIFKEIYKLPKILKTINHLKNKER